MATDPSSTVARELCKCHQCGGPVYENLVHHCGTAVIGKRIELWPWRWPVPDRGPTSDKEAR